MKQKLRAFWPVILCLVWALVYSADLANCVDLTTGLVTYGSPRLRYLVLVMCELLFFVNTRSGARSVETFRAPCRVLGVSMGVLGGFMAVVGILTTTGMFGVSWSVRLGGVLLGLGGAWFIRCAPLAWVGPWRCRVDSAWFGIIGTVCFVYIAVLRFEVAPASIQRMSHIMQVLSATIAMPFMVLLLRTLYLPGIKLGRDLRFMGVSCFLLCTCTEFVQAMFRAAANGVTQETFLGIIYGLVGVCGLVTAWYAIDLDYKEPEPEPKLVFNFKKLELDGRDKQ